MIALLVLLTAAWSVQERGHVLIAAAANAREKPSTQASILCPLSMGQELALEAREGDWVRVTTCGGGAYVHASLVRPVTDATRFAVREALVRERLAREDDSFASADALIRLVEAWGHQHAHEREAAARYALYRLQAIARAARLSHSASGLRSNLMRLAGESSQMFFYNEVGGSWMLRDEYIWKMYDEYKDAAAADDIAWFVTENGLGGECEGYMPCYLSAADRLEGEYLRRRPKGAHVDAALARVIDVAGWAGEPPRLDFNGVAQAVVCKDLAQEMAPLRRTVAASESPRRAAALSALDRLSALCR